MTIREQHSVAKRWPRTNTGEIRSEEYVAKARSGFEQEFTQLFDVHFPKLFRVINRQTGDPELSSDLVQDAFLRLLRRRATPDRPEAWLISVAMNLLRNDYSARTRRLRLREVESLHISQPQPLPSPAHELEREETRDQVRRTLAHLSERDRSLLLLQAEGYGYRDIAEALDLNSASVGTLLARAKEAFKVHWRGERLDASE